ncbi:hypothetical protein [Mariniflexile sp.]|uniref:hypothetical protein n=1 Tax=Mariniflexile sp. TaxID=1979402 RepID=UPI004048A1E7
MKKIFSVLFVISVLCTFQQLIAQEKEGIDKIKSHYDILKLNELETKYLKKYLEEKLIADNMAKEKDGKRKLYILMEVLPNTKSDR